MKSFTVYCSLNKSIPNAVAVPDVGLSSPVSNEIVVVFPAPL